MCLVPKEPVFGYQNCSDIVYENLSEEEFRAITKTTVFRSVKSLTGYLVRFCFPGEDEKKVRIVGEWSFSDEAHSGINSSLEASPEQWKNGYLVNTVKGWPAREMKKEEDGLWTCTIPLPSGTFGYYFLVGDEENCRLASDPSNLPFLADDRLNNDPSARMQDLFMCHIHVPYDKEKQSLSPDCSMEAPCSEAGRISYTPVTYNEKFSTWYGVYLPHHYNPEREEAYPLLVLIGNLYTSWFNNGVIQNILDNEIAGGKLEETVCVTVTLPEYIPPEENFSVLLDRILPQVCRDYHVSRDPERRAIGGLSFSSSQAMYAYFNKTSEFKYYLIMSPPMKGHIHPDYTKEELKKKKLCIGYGYYDFVLIANIFYLEKNENGEMVQLRDFSRFPSGSTYEYFWQLGSHGIPFTNKVLPYGHTWALWRRLAVYMFEEVLWK